MINTNFIIIYIFFAIYFFIGLRIAINNKRLMKSDALLENQSTFVPPSLTLGIIIFWLLDLIVVLFRKND